MRKKFKCVSLNFQTAKALYLIKITKIAIFVKMQFDEWVPCFYLFQAKFERI